jgi:rubrerythrin
MPRHGAWRRRDAVLGGASAFLAAGTTRLARPAGTLALADDDVPVLERALEVERRLVVSYEFAAQGDLLDSEVREATQLFAEQEREHAEALRSALIDLGVDPGPPPAAAEIEGLTDVDSQPAVLEFLVALEREAIAIYEAAAGELTAPDLLRTGAQIAANEAQHLVVLRQQLGEEAVPDVFEIETTADPSIPTSG